MACGEFGVLWELFAGGLLSGGYCYRFLCMTLDLSLAEECRSYLIVALSISFCR